MSFKFVETRPLNLKGYAKVAPQEQMDRVRNLGLSLDGARVIHVNSTAVGGGVAEILKSMSSGVRLARPRRPRRWASRASANVMATAKATTTVNAFFILGGFS